MEPYSLRITTFILFTNLKENKGQNPWVCSTPEQEFVSGLNNQVATHRLRAVPVN